MPISSQPLKQIQAIFLALVVGASHFSVPTPALAEPELSLPFKPHIRASEILTPSSLGKVEETYEGKKRKTIILIQDAHAIPDAQRNIQKLIEHFQKGYGVRLIGLEGAAAPLDAQFFRSFPDREKIKKVFEEYLQNGELTAGSAAAIFSETPGDFEGMEDWDLYEQGIEYFLATMKEEAKIDRELAIQRRKLSSQKKEKYSNELLKVDQVLEQFQKEHKKFFEAVRELAKYQQPLKGGEIEILLLHLEQENKKQNELHEEVGKWAAEAGRLRLSNDEARHFNQKQQDYRTSNISALEFSVYLKELAENRGLHWDFSEKFLKAAQLQSGLQNIEGSKLFREFELYALSVKKQLFRSEEERLLDNQSRRLYLLGKLAKLELNREEWNEIKGENLPVYENHYKFYQNAEKREDALTQNLLRRAEWEQGPSVFVSGGFHAEGLMARLKTQEISYALVRPTINSVPESIHYRAQMQGEVSWKSYFRSVNGKVNLYEAFLRAARDKLLDATTPVLIKSWRDQIIRDLAHQKKIEKAGSYTIYLDEISGKDSSSEMAKVELFIKGLRILDSHNQLTRANILKLLRPSTVPSGVTANAVVIRSEIRANLLVPFRRSEVRVKPFSLRSEVRTDLKKEQKKSGTPTLWSRIKTWFLEHPWLSFFFPALGLVVVVNFVSLYFALQNSNDLMRKLQDLPKSLHERPDLVSLEDIILKHPDIWGSQFRGATDKLRNSPLEIKRKVFKLVIEEMRDEENRTRGKLILERFRDEENRKLINEELENSFNDSRSDSYRKFLLGFFGEMTWNPEALDFLLRTSKNNQDAGVRVAATEVLNQLFFEKKTEEVMNKKDAIIALLREVMMDPDVQVRVAAIKLLIKLRVFNLGQEHVKTLIPMLDHPEKSVREPAADMLGLFMREDRPHAEEWLTPLERSRVYLEIARHPWPVSDFNRAIYDLGDLIEKKILTPERSAEVMEELFIILEDSLATTVMKASSIIYVLRFKYGKAGDEKLLELVKSRHVKARLFMASSLGNKLIVDSIGKERAIEKLLELLNDANWEVQKMAMFQLGQLEFKGPQLIEGRKKLIVNLTRALGQPAAEFGNPALVEAEAFFSKMQPEEILFDTGQKEAYRKMLAEPPSLKVLEFAAEILGKGLRAKIVTPEFLRENVRAIAKRLDQATDNKQDMWEYQIFRFQDALRYIAQADPEAIFPFAESSKTRLRISAAAILGSVNDVRSVAILEKLMDDADADVRKAAVRNLAELFRITPDFATLETVKKIGAFVSSSDVEMRLTVVLGKRNDLLEALRTTSLKRIQDFNNAKVNDFNILIFLSTLKNVTAEQKTEIIKTAFDYTAKAKMNRPTQFMHFMGVQSMINFLSKEDKAVLQARYPEIEKTLLQFVTSESLPYKKIFDLKRNPKQEFNLQFFVPLNAQEYINLLTDLGFKEVGKKGNFRLFQGVLNGKTFNIALDPTEHSGNYKGEVFKDFGDPAMNGAGYFGHSGLGVNLAYGLDKAPDVDLLQTDGKLVITLSCCSAQSYLGSVVSRYPLAQFVGTITSSYDSADLPALKQILIGISQEKTWPEIEKMVLPVARTVKYIFPHDPRRIDLMNFGAARYNPTGVPHVIYVPSGGILLLSEISGAEAFNFQPGVVDLATLPPDKAAEVVRKTGVSFQWNDFLKTQSQQLVPAGFELPFADQQAVYFLKKEGTGEQTKYKISINAGYRNSSKAALAMMLLYELNLDTEIINRKPTALDKLRGLQLAAEFAKYYQEERLFPHFLRKYGFDERIPFELFLKTLDDQPKEKRIEALKELLQKLNLPAAGAEDFEKAGLLSYDPFFDSVRPYLLALEMQPREEDLRAELRVGKIAKAVLYGASESEVRELSEIIRSELRNTGIERLADSLRQAAQELIAEAAAQTASTDPEAVDAMIGFVTQNLIPHLKQNLAVALDIGDEMSEEDLKDYFKALLKNGGNLGYVMFTGATKRISAEDLRALKNEQIAVTTRRTLETVHDQSLSSQSVLPVIFSQDAQKFFENKILVGVGVRGQKDFQNDPVLKVGASFLQVAVALLMAGSLQSGEELRDEAKRKDFYVKLFGSLNVSTKLFYFDQNGLSIDTSELSNLIREFKASQGVLASA